MSGLSDAFTITDTIGPAALLAAEELGSITFQISPLRNAETIQNPVKKTQSRLSSGPGLLILLGEIDHLRNIKRKRKSGKEEKQ